MAVTLAALSLVLGGCGENAQLSQEARFKDEALAVVRKYVALAAASKFEELSEITETIPKSARKGIEGSNPKAPETRRLPPATLTVAPSEESVLGSELAYIRRDFPKSISENNSRIVKVGDLVVNGSWAKVSVNLGNDEKYALLPWVFMLAKQEQNGQWKVYTIQSPAYAVDYNP